MGRGSNAGESPPGKSTGHTALPGHEARAWECGSEAGGAAVTVRESTRDAGPGARPLREPAAAEWGWGGRRPGTRGQQAVSGASTHPRPASLPRPQPAFLRPTLPRPRELPLALFVAPPFLGHVGAQREPGDRPRTRPSFEQPQPVAQQPHPGRRRKSPLRVRKARSSAERPCWPGFRLGTSRRLPAGGEQDPSSWKDLKNCCITRR